MYITSKLDLCVKGDSVIVGNQVVCIYSVIVVRALFFKSGGVRRKLRTILELGRPAGRGSRGTSCFRGPAEVS